MTGEGARIVSPVLTGAAHGFFNRLPATGLKDDEADFVAGLADDEEAGASVRLIDARDHLRVQSNRMAALECVAPGRDLALVEQVHGTGVHRVTSPADIDPAITADALVTADPRVVLGIYTADCAPILLADAHARIVAAVHAGWRGANAGVIEAAIGAMEAQGAARSGIRAAIGPTIAAASYEVDTRFVDQLSEDARRHLHPSPKSGHWQFDLTGFVRSILTREQVDGIADCGVDTAADPRFYSHRRASLMGHARTGRQISMIACAPF